MFLYKSTRGEKKYYKFSETIRKGIASDGGLFVPLEIPHFGLKDLKNLVNSSYQEIAFHLLSKFETDFSGVALKRAINKAYSYNFDTSEIVPLVHLKDNKYILELWHGPTLSFKDIALQLKPHFFAEAVRRENTKRKQEGGKPIRYLILVATSGDTGKAALEGYKNLENIDVIVLYPEKGVSKMQELSMVTQEGNNVRVLGVNGNFDDTQTIVKEVFNDSAFNKKLFEEKSVVLSSANSINWGRLLPQIVYHFSSYLDLVKRKVINMGDEIDIAIPTGNFGNIMAAYYGKASGLPIRKLICASNKNKILTEFIATGIYDISRKKLVKTPSPSMDILIASNLERFLYEITKNGKLISLWMKELKEKRKFEADAQTKKELRQIFYADWIPNNQCLETINKIYGETKYLIDPHTAVALAVVDRYQNVYGQDVPVIVSSTAHWSKFPGDIYKALTGTVTDEDDFDIINKIRKMTVKSYIPKNILALKNKPTRFREVCRNNRKTVEGEIIKYINSAEKNDTIQ